jgi:general secretion pathway protein C
LSLDPLLRKYFPAVVLVLLALAAYFQAGAATELVGAALISPAPSASVAKVPTLAHRGERGEAKTAQPIIDRNPFDSVTGPLNAKPIETPVPKASDLETHDPLAASACDGIAAFIITESTDPLWSVAALQGAGEPRPRMRRVGDDVAGRKIEFIGYNPLEDSPAVWLSGSGALCQVVLFRTQQVPPPAAPGAPPPVAPTGDPAAAPPPARGATSVPPEIAAKIQKVSDTEFSIDRSVVDNILERQAELMKSARIVPEQKDGKVLGVRLFGIRPDTLLGTLGLQNGDRLETINGFNMASPEKALEAYARLRTASNLNVKVSRRGQPVSIDYRIK